MNEIQANNSDHVVNLIGALLVLVHRAGGRVEIELSDIASQVMQLTFRIEGSRMIVETKRIGTLLPPVSPN